MRERRAWTQEDLAAASGVSERQVHRIEAGESAPKPATLAKLAAAFNTDASRLLTGRDSEELEELIADNTCRCCGAAVVERVSVPHRYGDEEYDTFECGSTRGWRDRPCPRDPRFPKLKDYDLTFFADEVGVWTCIALGRTEGARAVELASGSGPTRDKAAKWVERSHVAARHGYAAAEQQFPFSEMM